MALVLGSSVADGGTNYLPTSESHKISETVLSPFFYCSKPQKKVTFGCSAGSVQVVNKAVVYSPLAGLQSGFFSLFICVFFPCFSKGIVHAPR